ncbi:hypothetical protein BST92_03225 [Nonlabens arenilitoris]|uniref:Uncharacterized protein n=1 Tax=Nonlabens arenilitoris TaxID=1217969 RepID=A0A2S7U9Q4_9FLAO|nr:hypothetical protein [Nonlabens arenilitoris]PQJ31003.1 hypothetical protein BST92_03225 [Nonlabens arenilitoris]
MNILLYLDPGLGMMIAQAAIAAFAGFVLFYKTVVAKIKGWLGIKNKNEDSNFEDMYDDNDLKN